MNDRVRRYVGSAGFAIGWLAGLAVGAGMGGCHAGRGDGRGFFSGSRGSPWTILCLELRGPGVGERMEQVAETLRRTPGIEPARVSVHYTDESTTRLYYGVYYRRLDAKTGKTTQPPKLREDLDLIRQLGDEAGRRFFPQAIPVRMPVPDVGEPAWDLRKVSAAYSLQVAVFEPTDDLWDYKRAAADYCAWLRRKGYEAYYSHGDACSVVTVGVFGSDAVQTGPDGRTYYSQNVLTLQQDELLKYNLVNGTIRRIRSGVGESVAIPSRLVKVPQRAAAQSW